jgi:hypothetical protein
MIASEPRAAMRGAVAKTSAAIIASANPALPLPRQSRRAINPFFNTLLQHGLEQTAEDTAECCIYIADVARMRTMLQTSNVRTYGDVVDKSSSSGSAARAKDFSNIAFR